MHTPIVLALLYTKGVFTVERDHDINAFFKNMFYHSKGLKIITWSVGPQRQSGGSDR